MGGGARGGARRGKRGAPRDAEQRFLQVRCNSPPRPPAIHHQRMGQPSPFAVQPTHSHMKRFESMEGATDTGSSRCPAGATPGRGPITAGFPHNPPLLRGARGASPTAAPTAAPPSSNTYPQNTSILLASHLRHAPQGAWKRAAAGRHACWRCSGRQWGAGRHRRRAVPRCARGARASAVRASACHRRGPLRQRGARGLHCGGGGGVRHFPLRGWGSLFEK